MWFEIFPILRRLAIPTAALLLTNIPASSMLQADQFTLRDGRVIIGKLVSSKQIDKANPDKKSAPTDTEYVVEIEDGVLVALHKSDLVGQNGHLQSDNRIAAYEKAASRMEQTAEAHYEMAQKCAQAKLKELAEAHFLRAVDLNPDFTEARAAVKHRQGESGRWVRVEDDMRRRGKIELGSKWIYPEMAYAMKRKEEYEREVAQVKKTVNTFHQAYLRGTAPKADQALAAVEQLNNPIAIDEFANRLVDREKPLAGVKPTPEALKLKYVQLLSKFDHPAAFTALAKSCLLDPNESVRNMALNSLIKNGRSYAIEVISVIGLRSKDNDLVNRAAYALGKLEATESTLDLINALVTKHERAIRPQTDTYTPDGTTMGGAKTAIVDVRNEQVRNALAQITGQGNLGYDKAGWLAWFASVYAAPVDDLRRDF